MSRKQKDYGQMKTTFKAMMAAAVVAVGLSGVAQAATVNQWISSTAGVGNTVALEVSDSDVSVIYDSAGALKPTGTIAIGDYILGTIDISFITIQGLLDVTTSLGSLDEELTGFYAFKVASVDTSGTGTFTAVPLLTADLSVIDPSLVPGVSNPASAATDLTFATAYGFGDTNQNSMVALFTDAAKDYNPATGSSIPLELDFDDARDGTFWSAFGDGTWTVTGTGVNVTSIDADLAATGDIAAVTFSLTQTLNGSSNLLFNLPLTEGSGGASTLQGGKGIGLVGSDLTFASEATVIPIPAAVGPALALMGGVAFVGRARQRRGKLINFK